MDTSRGASIFRALIAAAILFCATFSAGQSTPDTAQKTIQQFVAAKRWTEAAQLCEELQPRSADDLYSCGLAFGQLRRYDDARMAFNAGKRLTPGDPRFDVELAGLAFLQKRYSKATRHLLRAERRTPGDAYVNDFLGTTLYLNGNVEAALKYWNRVAKPVVENVSVVPTPRLDPVLLDSALTARPGAMLTAAQLRTTQARLDALGVFPVLSPRPNARSDGKYDLAINSVERNGFGSNALDALLSTFGSVFFQTITPEYYNIGHTATNVRTLVRWDAQKRRAAADISGPLRRNATWRYRAGFDLRGENWSVANFSTVNADTLGTLTMRRAAVNLGVESIRSARWTWRTGAELSWRNFRNANANALPPALLLDGFQLKHTFATTYELLRLPQRLYSATLRGRSELGRLWSGTSPSFLKLEGDFEQRWSLSATGDDYEFMHRLRGGRTLGSVPFDELFMLGLERDNDLPMRGHVGTHNGRKGNAPLGRNYVVSNIDFDKRVWSNGLIAVKLGPFLDVGKITDRNRSLGSREWLVDTGAQLHLRVLGLGIALTYGRDLRGGRNAIYVSTTK